MPKSTPPSPPLLPSPAIFLSLPVFFIFLPQVLVSFLPYQLVEATADYADTPAVPFRLLKNTTRIERSDESQIIRIFQQQQSSSQGEGSSSSIRLGHLLGLQGLTYPKIVGNTTIRTKGAASLLFNDIAVYLAFKQFNERRGDILPHLPTLLEGCDFYWTYESRDTQRKALVGASQLIQAMTTTKSTTSSSIVVDEQQGQQIELQHQQQHQHQQQQPPFAYFGAHLSSVSKPLSTLGAAFDLPQISGASTSSELESSPYFARTISTNEADARAIMVYYKQVLGVKHVANIYLYNQWGIFYNAALRKYAQQFGIRLQSFPLDNTPQSINLALEALKESQYRYVFATLNIAQSQTFELAFHKGLIGNTQYVWFAGEFAIPETTKYNRTNPSHHALAMALQSVGTINLYQEPFPAMDIAMKEMATNVTLQEEYFRHIVERNEVIGSNFTLKPNQYRHAFRHYTNFDAVIALGLAACKTPGLFTGKQLYQQLTSSNINTTTFDGTSGKVSFDPTTGNRLATTVKFRIEYIQLSDKRSDDQFYRFDTHVAGIVQGDDYTPSETPFVYYNNQTIPPPDLPPPQREDLNLIPKGVQWFGYLLSIAALALSLVCLIWAIVYRGIYVVRAAQPIFLVMLCIGTIMIGSAIIPLSFPGSYSSHKGTHALDVACILPVWLVSLGFVIAFSSIHAKTWRMLKIMKSANQMIRTQVQPKDVILPFLILMAINLVLLLCMTILSPFRFERVPTDDSYDKFGRSNASYGSCNYFDNTEAAMFMIPLFIIDFLWLLLVLYMAYNARNLSTAFSESQYLVMTVISLFETFLLGVPILVAVKDNPTAFYISASLILAVSVAAILIPIFLPKYMHRKIERGRSAIQRTSHEEGCGSGLASTTRPSVGVGGSTFGSCGISGLEPPPLSSSSSRRVSSVLPSSATSPAPHQRPSVMQRISDLTLSAFSSRRSSSANTRRSSAAAEHMTITSRDNSWHFELTQGQSLKKSKSSTSKKNPVLRGSSEHERQVQALGIDKYELEALDLIKELDLEGASLGSTSNHSRKTC